MNQTIRRMAMGVLLCGLSGAASPWADESRIPIFGVIKIGQSGHYVLTQNITASAGPTITITAPNRDVSLDLNGFTVSHTGSSSVIHINNASHVAIRNGFISGGVHSVSSAVSGLTLSVERVTMLNPSGAGVDVTNLAHFEMTDSDVSAAGAAYGIHVVAAAGEVVTGRLDGNTVTGPDTCVAILQPRTWMISNNIIRECVDTGLLLNGIPGPVMGSNIVRDNVFAFFTQLNATGIRIASVPGNTVTGNTIAKSPLGLWLVADDNRVSRNLFGTSSTDSSCGGVVCVNGANNILDGNAIEGTTTTCGISFSDANAIGNAYRSNMVRIVPGSSVCVAGGATATDAGGNVL